MEIVMESEDEIEDGIIHALLKQERKTKPQIDVIVTEHQIVDELLFRQAEVLANRLVTNVLRRMTTRAVVHEISRAALQG